MANPRFVGARLRKGLDEDLVEATKGMDSASKSELIRTGLRWALGIRSHRVLEVMERPIRQPKVWLPPQKEVRS